MLEKDQKIAVGLDIGTTKIVVMVGAINKHKKIKILGIGRSKSFGVKRGVVNNITKTIQSIKDAVSEAESISGKKVEKVVVGIAGQHIRSLHRQDYITRSNYDEVISEEDVRNLERQIYNMTMPHGEEIIHVLPQEFKVDDQSGIKEPIGMYGNRLDGSFHIVVGQTTSIRNVGRCIKDAGLEMSNITLEPLASAKAVLSEEEKEAGVALIDIGGGTTDLAIFKDGIIRHTAVIPFGGNVVTDDIKEGCLIIERQAELLKVKFGSAWPNENTEYEKVSVPGLRGQDPKEFSLRYISGIIYSRMNEIIELVYQEIRNYIEKEGAEKKLISGIVLTGGGSNLKHLVPLVNYITSLPVRIGHPNENLSGDSDEELLSPEYATAVGLLMEGLMEEFEKEESLEEKSIREAELKENSNENSLNNEQENKVDAKFKKEKKWSLKGFGERLKEFLDNSE